MNTAKHIPRPRPGFTGEWSIDIFLDVLAARGIEASGAEIARRVTAWRRASDPDAQALDRRTANHWLDGSRDPSRAKGGAQPAVIELAMWLDVSLEHLLSGGAP